MPSLDDDLALAFALADAADAVSTAHFRSEALRTVTKDDGTPVSEVDLAVEQAMLAMVRHHRPAEAAVGEEVGPHPAPSAGPGAGAAPRRWIFDGIDGTHNYAAGRTGWATIVALQDGDGVVVAMITAPLFGRRWWATRGGGAWTASYRPDGANPAGSTFEHATATRLACTATERLDDASVIVIPFEGFLLGWRNTVAKRFTPPAEPRSHCFALDAAMVAEGRLDAAIMTFGSLWDHAGPSLLVTEAGGVFRDAWGGTRLDSTTAVHTNPALVDQVLATLAELRPPTPDEPLLARKVSTPIGTAEEQEADPWRRFGLRPMPSMSARVHVATAAPAILEIVDERAAELGRPFLGVTTDGTVRPRFGPAGRPGPGPGTAAVAEAAQAFLGALTPEQRSRATFAFDADEWRMWINVHMNHFRHGLMLEDLNPAQREAALDIVRASLSARCFHQARSIMRLNELLAEITGDHEAFGEWPYFLSIFGDPAGPAPWGWQIDGHHLCVNAVAVDGRLVTTPTFMGAEPRRVNLGPLAGTFLFDPEESRGLDLVRSLDGPQRDRAVLYPSIHPDHIPALLQNAFDGRMAAGAFHDNLVAPYQGVAGVDLSDAQRRLLMSLAATYVGWNADAHAAGRLAEVEAHLDETWFSWYGGTDDTSPFYYRVHSPVLLVEFDHHPGVALDNEEPSRHHVHTVVRTPNGGDYGTDLLADHHRRFDHRGGRHTPRNQRN
ncbi:MAG: inositol monophosphatase family protein [Acidimicrobiales bacterium]